jgi:hypothetical protein
MIKTCIWGASADWISFDILLTQAPTTALESWQVQDKGQLPVLEFELISEDGVSYLRISNLDRNRLPIRLISPKGLDTDPKIFPSEWILVPPGVALDGLPLSKWAETATEYPQQNAKLEEFRIARQDWKLRTDETNDIEKSLRAKSRQVLGFVGIGVIAVVALCTMRLANVPWGVTSPFIVLFMLAFVFAAHTKLQQKKIHNTLLETDKRYASSVSVLLSNFSDRASQCHAKNLHQLQMSSAGCGNNTKGCHACSC